MNVAVDFGLLPLNEVLDILKNTHDKVEIVITGRYARPELIELADLVSEIKEIKHPFQKGILAREGIDF